MAAFDADRSIARSYLLEASALLNVRDEVRGDQCLRLNTAGAGGLALWQLKRVVDYIEKNLTDKIAGEDLATVINVSLGQLFRGFKTSVGLTPFQYITKRRIDFACDLMKTTAEPLSQMHSPVDCAINPTSAGCSGAKWVRPPPLAQSKLGRPELGVQGRGPGTQQGGADTLDSRTR